MTRVRQAGLVLLGVLLLGAGAFVLGERRAGEPQPAAADPAKLADTALAALPAVAAPAAVEDHGPVTAMYHQTRQSYLGDLTLWVSCAGAGQITLAVSGLPYGETGSTEPRDLTRVAADCAAAPRPARVVFAGDQFLQNLVFDLVAAESAVGVSGFAFRVTSDTGDPVSPADDVSPAGALREADEGDWEMTGGVEPYAVTDFGPAPVRGRYSLVAACAGAGTLVVRVGGQRRTVKCSWPPRRSAAALDRLTGAGPTVTVEYRSTSSAPGKFALRLVPSAKK